VVGLRPSSAAAPPGPRMRQPVWSSAATLYAWLRWERLAPMAESVCAKCLRRAGPEQADPEGHPRTTLGLHGVGSVKRSDYPRQGA
jgi:hypothetical protein